MEAQVDAWVTGGPAGDTIQTTVTARWDPGDPLAVTLIFPDTRWLVSREVMTDALFGEPYLVNGADVHMEQTCDTLLEVTLMPGQPGISAVVALDAGQVTQFLNQTFTITPMGREFDDTDWDAAMTELEDTGG